MYLLTMQRWMYGLVIELWYNDIKDKPLTSLLGQTSSDVGFFSYKKICKGCPLFAPF